MSQPLRSRKNFRPLLDVDGTRLNLPLRSGIGQDQHRIEPTARPALTVGGDLGRVDRTTFLDENGKPRRLESDFDKDGIVDEISFTLVMSKEP